MPVKQDKTGKLLAEALEVIRALQAVKVIEEFDPQWLADRHLLIAKKTTALNALEVIIKELSHP